MSDQLTAPKLMTKKPALSTSQIWFLSMGFLGIQGGFALQNGNASRILQNLGADVHDLAWFWLVAPITGLLVQPIIGYFSDKTWTGLGRRKPFFLVGAILAALGLMFLPNADKMIGDTGSTLLGVSAVLWIAGLFLAFMDASFNIAMEPFRALVGDMLPQESEYRGLWSSDSTHRYRCGHRLMASILLGQCGGCLQ